MWLALIALLVGTAALNIAATIASRRSTLFEPDHKRAQLFLIWLVPLGGAVLVLNVVREPPALSGPKKDTTVSECGPSSYE